MSESQSPRLPPNQQLIRTGRWPVVGESSPRLDDSPWQLEVVGCVQEPRCFSLPDLANAGLVDRLIDIHCVTRWSKFDCQFRGLPLRNILTEETIGAEARFVSFVARSDRQHSSSLPLNTALELDCLLAVEAEGQPLAPEHGGPLRLIVPEKYFYKSVKWLERIELLTEDRLGYWEADAGYHNEADPWLEQRYVAATISKQLAAKLLATRDFSARDLLGLSAADRDLTGLVGSEGDIASCRFPSLHPAGREFFPSKFIECQTRGSGPPWRLFCRRRPGRCRFFSRRSARYGSAGQLLIWHHIWQ